VAIPSAKVAALVGALLSFAAPARAQDWPQWRGPNRDGIARDVKVPDTWPKAVTEEWKVEVGEGIASPVVAGGKVYAFVRQKDAELVLCLDAATGKEAWRSEPYPAPVEIHPAAAAYGKYPRSTPTVADGKLYAFGVSGILSCFDAATGKLLWRKDSAGRYPSYGASASPLVADGLCVVPMGDGVKKGDLTAFDARTGEVKWTYADGSGPAYGSPVLADLAGGRQVVTFTSSNLVSISAATGKRLWKVEAPFDGQERCVTPALYKDTVVFAEYKKPPRAVRPEKDAAGVAAKDVWKADGVNLYYSSPVVVGDAAYGFSSRNGRFFCLDAKTGETLWEGGGKRAGNASVVAAGGVLLLLTDRGELVVARASPKAFEPLADYKVSDTETHAHPAYLGERILIKDRTTLRSLAIREKGR
jgi:outer membrane protein assembly factor BamB